MNNGQLPQVPRWVQKVMTFMAGRNGPDALGNACLYLYILLIILNLFIGSRIVSVLALLLLFWMFFRMFSKNLVRRRAENMKYWNLRERVRTALRKVGFLRALGDWWAKKKKRLAKLPTNVYRTCPGCKAELCLPRRRGKHTVRCPRCGNEFPVRILF